MRQGKPIQIVQFPGMNNVARLPNTPQIVANMDTTSDQRLQIRSGYRLFKALTDAHSVFSDGHRLFCAGTGTASLESLWKINPSSGELTELSPVAGKLHPLWYAVHGTRLFVSSIAWNGIYDYNLGAVRSWGADVSDDPDLIDGFYNSERLMALGVTKAPLMECLTVFGTRIWGVAGNRLIYSEPFALEWFKPDNFLTFPEELTMIAVLGADGFYVASETTTWFITGLNPEDYQSMKKVGDGALKGSLQYIPLSKYGNNTPIWTTSTGIVAGSQGQIVPLTDTKIKFRAEGPAAAFLRTVNGNTQYLSNFGLPPDDVGAFSDTATCEVFRKGKLI